MKRLILLMIATIAYHVGVISLFYWLNRNSKRILTFHNVLPDELVIDDGVTESETDFISIIHEVARKFPFSVDIFDPKTVTITFDDGYANQAEVAFKILSDFNLKGNKISIPAYLFLTGNVKEDGGEVLLVDQLLLWCANAPKDIVETLKKQNASPWVSYIRPAYVASAETRGYSVWNELNALYPFEKLWSALGAKYRHLRFDKITMKDVEVLESNGWQVGCHAKTHFPLSALSYQEKVDELTPPSRYQYFKNKVLSYPYGELLSIDEATLDVAKEIGYPYALGNITAPNKLCGDYFLPRMTLNSNKYLLHFRLSGFEHFLKYRRLLWSRKAGI